MRRFFLVLVVVTLLVLVVASTALAGNGNRQNRNCFLDSNNRVVCGNNKNGCFNKHGKLKKKCNNNRFHNDRFNDNCFVDFNGNLRCS